MYSHLISTPHNIKFKYIQNVLYMNFNNKIHHLTIDSSISISFFKSGILVYTGSYNHQKLVGTYKSIIQNVISGLSNPFVCNLVLRGVGYKADISGDNLELSVGYSDVKSVYIPSKINVVLKGNKIMCSSFCKQSLGEFVSTLTSVPKKDLYKGKGIYLIDYELKLKDRKK